eukprot:755355-Hanusia_phi.AAC.4
MEPASCLMVPALNREHEVEAIVQHVGAALENIEIRESSASSWLNKIETFEYRSERSRTIPAPLTRSCSVMGSVVSTIKTLLECEHVEIVPFLETPTGARSRGTTRSTRYFVLSLSFFLQLSISSLRKSLAQKVTLVDTVVSDRVLQVAIERTLLILKDSETASRIWTCGIYVPPHVCTARISDQHRCRVIRASVDGSLEGVLLAFNSTTGINFGKKDEIRSVKIANDVATFLRNCNEFSKVHREVERQKSTLNKYMSDIKVVAPAGAESKNAPEVAGVLRWVPVGVRVRYGGSGAFVTLIQKEDLDAYKCHDTGFAVTEAQDSVAGAVALRAKKLEVIKGRVLNNNAEAKSWCSYRVCPLLMLEKSREHVWADAISGGWKYVVLSCPGSKVSQKVVGVLQVARLADTSPENSSAWPQPFSKRSKEILDLMTTGQVVDPLPGLLNQGIRLMTQWRLALELDYAPENASVWRRKFRSGFLQTSMLTKSSFIYWMV